MEEHREGVSQTLQPPWSSEMERRREREREKKRQRKQRLAECQVRGVTRAFVRVCIYIYTPRHVIILFFKEFNYYFLKGRRLQDIHIRLDGEYRFL